MKTNHSVDSVGYIIATPNKSITYLVDGVIPPEETLIRLDKAKLELLILEGTMDDLILHEGVRWHNFSIGDAVDFWKTLRVPKCILTHASFHSWKNNKLVAGRTKNERNTFVKKNPGLEFAHDGLRIEI